MIKLDGRLLAIRNEIKGKSLADIGTDHGKIIISALLEKKIQKGIAIDISEKSLNKAIKLAKENNVQEQIEFIVGDGLSPLQKVPDCIVIAGMGGNEIINILQGKDINSRYILVPHQDTIALRKYLLKHSFFIEKDYVVKDCLKYYDIIVIEKNGKNNYKEDEIYIGKNKPKSQYFLEKIKLRKSKIESIIRVIEKKSNKTVKPELLEELEAINKCLK